MTNSENMNNCSRLNNCNGMKLENEFRKLNLIFFLIKNKSIKHFFLVSVQQYNIHNIFRYSPIHYIRFVPASSELIFYRL